MGCIQSIAENGGQGHLFPPTHHSKISSAALYNALPTEFETHKVSRVYDGDTLTLENGKRVRFLGIDCPEISEKQPFAQEAKDFVSAQCLEKDVFFSFEPNSEKNDHYGRLLAWVWVLAKQEDKNDSGRVRYLNLNEALIVEGLANVYTPGRKKLQNVEKMISLQKKARENKRGKWGSFRDISVYKTRNGKAFHKKDCKHLSRSKHLIKGFASAFSDEGLYPCRTCLPEM